MTDMVETSFQKPRVNFDPTNKEDRITYSTHEVGEMFGVTSDTVRDWLVAGRLIGFKLSPRSPWRVKHADLLAFANARYPTQSRAE